MKNAGTIFLLVLMVSTQTPVGQLLKLPLLIEHFIKHQKKDGDSLFSFLDDHYSQDHNDADLPEDEQLPFKNITICSVGSAILPASIKTNSFVPLSVNDKIGIPNSFTPQQYLAGIFHPPRV